MNKWLLCALAGCLALSVSSGQGNQQGPDVLVLDLEYVIDNCDEHADLVGKLERTAKGLQKKYSGQVRDLQQAQQTLLEQTLSLRGADWYPAVKKSLLKEGELKGIEAFHKVEFGDKILRGMEALMKSAKEAAEQIRAARRAKIVLISKMTPIKFESQNDLKSELISRRVMCVDRRAGADITKEVLDIMNKALSSIVDQGARTLLLDISGVAMVDTAVANHLIKIAKAAVLMGCQTIISGISPAIAQTITELGIELGSIRTTSTIEHALREAVATASPSGRATSA